MKEKIKITIVYDNNPMINGLKTDWGFACLIENGKNRILFDTGDNGKILLDNMELLRIDPKSIDIVFLSHYHHDHTGGLKDFLNVNSNVKVYFPQSFPVEIVNLITNSGAEAYPVSNLLEIVPNVFSLGELDGKIPEQSLAINTAEGIIVITGCAHPGILNIVQLAKEKFPNKLISIVIGGFHLHKLTEDEISQTVSKLYECDVLQVAPTHCTGEAARNLFKYEFDKNYKQIGVGEIIEIN